MDELLQEFLTETGESIATLDVELVNLEQNPDNPTLIDNIFRLVHTIKGTCGFLGLPRLEKVAHSGENILGKFRDGDLTVSPQAVTLILEAIDRIRDLLAGLEATESEPDGDDADLIQRLDAFAAGRAADRPAEAGTPASIVAVVSNQLETAIAAPVFAEADDPADDAGSEQLVDSNYDQDLGRELKEGEVSLSELERIFQETEVTVSVATPAATKQAETKQPVAEAAPRGKTKASDSPVASQSIRVNVDLLENLMTMVSELVLTRNQLLQMIRGLDDSEFTGPLQRLSSITTELQERVMKTRMQPIGNAWAKLPRIVRDLSHELSKKIDLQMLGQDTELDRQVLELIKDPLTHMVRNSADHGMETPQQRLACNKPETGRITLNAMHEGGHIIIEISDDGHGINVEKVKTKILENGLATKAELESMSDPQIQKFIFKAGFSTADSVTSVSGRGVGLDVVRTNIEKIGGTIDLRSEAGEGSCFTVKIPLTLAIVSALIVECSGERFAIPQLSVVELVRTSGRDADQNIETINDTPVMRLRDRLLPLVYLDRVIGLAKGEEGAGGAQQDGIIIVAQVGAHQFGIVVDRVFDTEEIVVKPVAPMLRDLPIYSGNTILGDGSVIMILDPNGIAAATGEAAVPNSQPIDDAESASANDAVTSLLVFRAGGDEPKAVPLALVARLEEIDADKIETSNGQAMTQYRGKLMPLISMTPDQEIRSEGRQPIVVFVDRDQSMGLVVDEIADIVDQGLEIEMASKDAGLLGTAIVAGKATQIVDVSHYLKIAFADWFENSERLGMADDKRRARLLLVDDSPFFRTMLVPMLQVAGYDVTTAENPVGALELRETGAAFDVIVSDIEMPGMSGFEFAEECRRDDRWQATPIVALSAHNAPQDFERGRTAGFTDYVSKSDRDALLQSLAQTLALRGAVA